MSENAPPQGANATGGAESRGVPYYESIKTGLTGALKRKQQLDEQVAKLEQSIYVRETQYLEETGAGNIIKGFDNYVKGSSGTGGGGGGTATRRKGGITETDRIFSKSSATFSRDSPAPGSLNTTPSHAATPNSGPASARESNHPTPTSAAPKANKKKKVVDEDDG